MPDFGIAFGVIFAAVGAALIIWGFFKLRDKFRKKPKKPLTAGKLLLIGLVWFLLTFELSGRFIMGQAPLLVFLNMYGVELPPFLQVILFYLSPSFPRLMLYLFFASIGFLLFCLIRAIVARKRLAGRLGLVVGCMIVSAVMIYFHYTLLPQAGVVTEKETYITDIDYEYNRDGTIRHNSDGEKMLDTDYGTRTVERSGNNYILLIPPIIGNGALIYSLYQTRKKEDGKAEEKDGDKSKPAQ